MAEVVQLGNVVTLFAIDIPYIAGHILPRLSSYPPNTNQPPCIDKFSSARGARPPESHGTLAKDVEQKRKFLVLHVCPYTAIYYR